MSRLTLTILCVLGSQLIHTISYANEADVIDVKVRCFDDCTFYVTVKHQDSGWEHFANRWEVLTLEGDVLATRKLLHPHVNAQPFMRSLSHIVIPKNIKQVRVRAYDLLHGYGGKTFVVEVNK